MGASWPKAILLIPLIWWTLRLGSGSASWCFLDYVNLAFHEAGHLFLSFLGKTIHYLGGTIGQLVVPALLAVRFIVKERQAFGAAICVWWFGENFTNIAVYMADARELALPLVGGGDHDWNELFFRFGTLGESAVERISSTTHATGVMFMLIGLVWAGCLLAPENFRRELTVRMPWLETALHTE